MMTPPAAKEMIRALELAHLKIKKQFGMGAIMKLGEEHPLTVDVIATGSIGLTKRGLDAADELSSAHLTLAPVRQPGRDWTEAPAGAGAAAGPPPCFAVHRLCVVESQRNPRGSVFTVRAEANGDAQSPARAS